MPIRTVLVVLSGAWAIANDSGCHRAKPPDRSLIPGDAELTAELLPYCRVLLVATERGCRYRIAQQDRYDGGVVIGDANGTAACGDGIETCTGPVHCVCPPATPPEWKMNK